MGGLIARTARLAQRQGQHHRARRIARQVAARGTRLGSRQAQREAGAEQPGSERAADRVEIAREYVLDLRQRDGQIGRASCRERV